MGQTIEKVARESGHEVVCIIDIDREEPIADAEVMIDFSHAGALDDTLTRACDNKLNLVIGTTGWNDRLDEVRQRVENAGIACVYASNFSPGANVVVALAQRAGGLVARFPQYAAGLEERHHSQKLDAPSGTALRIAAAAKTGSDGKLDPDIVSSRVGAEFGLHTLFFDSPDDLIEISHRAMRSDAFAREALFAAEMLRRWDGLVGFDELVRPWNLVVTVQPAGRHSRSPAR